MDKFTQSNLKTLRGEIEQAIKDTCAKHGVSIKMGSGSFSSGQHSFKVELKLPTSALSPDSMNVAKANFERCAKAIGLEPSDFGKEFVHKNDTLRVAGISLNRRANPVLVVRVKDGKEYHAPAYMVKMSLLTTVGN